MTGNKNLLMHDNKKSLLHDTKVGSGGNIQLPIRDSAEVSHIGNYPMTGGDLLRNVLCVPTFKFNLLSVSKVTRDLNCYAKHCVFRNLCTGKVKVTGKEQGGLYILNTPNTGDIPIGMKSMAVHGPSDPEM